MSWTQDQLDKLRDKMSLAKRAGEFITASEISIVLGLIHFWRRATVQTGWAGPTEGMLPTIGTVKAEGVRGVIIECRKTGCGNRRKLSFDELNLPDSVVFIEIAKRRGFRCYRCGGREVLVSAHHPSALGPRPS